MAVCVMHVCWASDVGKQRMKLLSGNIVLSLLKYTAVCVVHVCWDPRCRQTEDEAFLLETSLSAVAVCVVLGARCRKTASLCLHTSLSAVVVGAPGVGKQRMKQLLLKVHGSVHIVLCRKSLQSALYNLLRQRPSKDILDLVLNVSLAKA